MDSMTRLANAIAGLPYSFRFLYVNDGSSDDSSEVLAKLATADARVQPYQSHS